MRLGLRSSVFFIWIENNYDVAVRQRIATKLAVSFAPLQRWIAKQGVDFLSGLAHHIVGFESGRGGRCRRRFLEGRARVRCRGASRERDERQGEDDTVVQAWLARVNAEHDHEVFSFCVGGPIPPCRDIAALGETRRDKAFSSIALRTALTNSIDSA